MPPKPPGHAWDNFQTLTDHCRSQGWHNLAAALCDYETERNRQRVAIRNLENQLNSLVESYKAAMKKQSQVGRILRESGLDLEVLMQTDDIFRETKKS